jgi:hypothetical protein
MKKILAIGPYIGDFEHEITTFRPYATWLSKVIDYDEIYISTHYNRSFLYNDIIKDKSHIIPINTKYSKNESNQIGFIQKGMLQKEYNSIIRDFKNYIISLGYKKKDIEHIYIKYRKTIIQYPIHNRVFNKIEISNDKYILNEFNNKFLFIPYGIEEDVLEFIYNKIKDDVVIIGNTSCLFENENVILQQPNYVDNGIKYIFSLLNNCKGVITPLNYWTLIANLQNIPIFSWGKNVNMFRENGIYNFGSKQYSIIPEISVNVAINSIQHFIERRSN